MYAALVNCKNKQLFVNAVKFRRGTVSTIVVHHLPGTDALGQTSRRSHDEDNPDEIKNDPSV